MEKKYRLGYSNLLSVNNIVDNKKYGKIIALKSMAIYEVISLKTGEEIFFSEPNVDYPIGKIDGKELYIPDFMEGVFYRDNPEYLQIGYSNFELLRDLGYIIKCKMDENFYQVNVLNGKCNKEGYPYVKNINITKKEFLNIIKENLDIFDNEANKPVEMSTFKTYEVSE